MRTILVLLALGLAACGQQSKSAPPSTPKSGPLVVFEHGGGYASQPRRLVVGRDGKARLTVTTGTKVTNSTFALTGARRDDLARALDAARGVKLGAPQGGCDDCFTYKVKADGVDFSIDEIGLESAPDQLQRVVGVLERLSTP